MKLGLLAGYAGRKINIPLDAIKHAEKLGYDECGRRRLTARMR